MFDPFWLFPDFLIPPIADKTPVAPPEVRLRSVPPPGPRRAPWEHSELGAQVRRAFKKNYRGIQDPRFHMHRRIAEQIAVMQALHANSRGANIAVQMRACSLDRLCGRTHCVVCKWIHIQAANSLLYRLFAQTPRQQLYFETVIVEVFYGRVDQLVPQIKTAIAAFRQDKRALLNRLELGDRNRGQIQLAGWFEIDYFDGRATLERWRHRHQTSRKTQLKLRLLQHLGFDPDYRKDFVVLTYHAVGRIPDVKRYKRTIKSQYPFKRQVVVKHLHDDKAVPDNLARLAGYMLKSSPRYARLPGEPKRGKILRERTLRRYTRLYDHFGFRGLKGHFGISRRSDVLVHMTN